MIKHTITPDELSRILESFPKMTPATLTNVMDRLREKYSGMVLLAEGDPDIGAYTGNYELRFTDVEQKVRFLLTEM